MATTTLSFDLTDDQVQSLESYAALPMHLIYSTDPLTGMQTARSKYADGLDVLKQLVQSHLEAVIGTCPPPAHRLRLEQIAALQQDLKAAAVVTSTAVAAPISAVVDKAVG